MGRTAHLSSARCIAAFALATALTHPALAAKKKKKPKPPPPSTATVEIDTPAPAPAPAPEPTPPPPAEPASAPEPAEPAEPTHAHSHGESHTATYTKLGAKHAFVLDDLSGFRASTAGGVAYAGPLGFSTQSFNENILTANGTNGGTNTIHETTVWVAPSADYFVFEHVSIGALLEFALTTANYTQSAFGTAGKNTSLPTTTNVTILPRAGYLLSFGEHWGLWPRLGLGWGLLDVIAVTNAGTGTTPTASSSSTFLLDADVGVLYRVDSHWFIRAAPEFTWGPGASLVSFAVGGGFGYTWDL